MLARSDLKNTISLVGAEGIGRGLAFILTILIARELGVYDFGMYSTAVSFVFLFSVFIEIGLSTYVYRESSKDNEASSKYIGHALVIQILLSILVGSIAFIIALLLGYSKETRIIIFILWFWIIGISLGQMVRVAFKAYQRMELAALMSIFENGSRFILILLALKFGMGVFGIAIASLISAFLMLTASALFALGGKYLQFSQVQWKASFSISLLKSALPFAISMIAMVMMYRLSTILLSIIKGDYDVGIFDASFKLTMSLFVVPGLICNAFFPKLSQLAVTDQLGYTKVVMLLTRYIFLLMYPALMIIYIFAPQIIGVIYTEDFSPTIPVLQILVWVNLFNAGVYIGMYALNAANHEKRVMKMMFLGVSIKVSISVFLIFGAGYTGAAIGALVSEIFVATFLFYYLQREEDLYQLSTILAKIVVVTLASFGVIIYIQWIHLSNIATLGWFMIIFVSTILLSKLVTAKDLANLKQLIQPSAVVR